jgi:putative heme-binding domain-containing protein
VQSSKCLDCHRIGESGSRVGPDLSDIGSRRSPALLQRAIVSPDDEVLPENRHVRVVSSDGAAVQGKSSIRMRSASS